MLCANKLTDDSVAHSVRDITEDLQASGGSTLSQHALGEAFNFRLPVYGTIACATTRPRMPRVQVSS